MTKYLYEDLTYEIRGALFNVYNELGPGYKENVYHNALVEEFKAGHLSFISKKRINIMYREQVVGLYEPDFVIDDKVLLEIKAVPAMPKIYEKQLYYYLMGTNYKLGLLVNFGEEKLVIKRRIYEEARKNRR